MNSSKDTHEFEAIKKNRHVEVEYPPELLAPIQRNTQAWSDLCALSPEIKQKLRFVEDPRYLDGEGYELKTTPGDNLDLKENFHFTLSAYERLAESAKAHPVLQEFIESSRSLIESSAERIVAFASELEISGNMPGLADEVASGKNRWILRNLHYFPGHDQDIVAGAHTDKAGFTLHLFEDKPGLEFYDGVNWQPFPTGPGHTVILPDIQMQYRSGGLIEATWHRVVANADVKAQGRKSAVMFIPFHKTPYFDKVRFGRQQDLPLGFNYGMPFEKFREMFRDSPFQEG
ncbi:MAG: 2OG-Fe(II) oxygenase family protein [Candidatus Paceibacterota bacterium]